MESIVDMVINIWFTKDFQQKDPDTITKIREMILSVSPIGYGGCCMAIAAMDNRESNKSITTPTMVIVGAHDVATPAAQGKTIFDSIQGAKLVTLNGAHLSNISDAEGFNKALLEFLKQ